MLAPGGEVEGDSLWSRLAVESLNRYPEFVRELREESGLSIDYRPCGALELAYTDYELRDLTRRSQGQQQLGIPSGNVTLDEALALAPKLATDGLAGARHYPQEACVDPRGIIAALVRVLDRRGVRIDEQSPVHTIDPRRTTVLAAGAWSSALSPGQPASYPVKGHLIGYDLPPGSLGPILRHGHTYILQRASGFTIAGSTTERAGFDTTVDPAIVARLHQRARRYLPTLLRSSPDVSWTGLRPAVEGDQPQVGRLADTNLWLAYGHYRNGILLAPVTAERIAASIMSNSETD